MTGIKEYRHNFTIKGSKRRKGSTPLGFIELRSQQDAIKLCVRAYKNTNRTLDNVHISVARRQSMKDLYEKIKQMVQDHYDEEHKRKTNGI